MERLWDSGGSGIDIRYNDVDEFIRTHPSTPALTETEALAIAQEYSGKHLTIIDFEWWELAEESPHNSKDPEKQKIRDALEAIPETCHLFAADDGSFIAVGRRYGTVYTYDSESGFALFDIDMTDYGIGGASSSVDIMNGKTYVNLTEGSLVVISGDLPNYRFYTNSERIIVSIPRGEYAGTFYLYATDYPEDFIMTFELNQSNRTKTFTSLTSARNYFLVASGLNDSVLVTVTD